MGKDIRSGPLGNVGIGEIRIGSRPSNVRVPRVSRTWGLLPLIPSWPELLRVAPPRIVVRHCRLGTGRRLDADPSGPDVASTRIPRDRTSLRRGSLLGRPSQRLKTFPVRAVIATPRIPSSARNFAKRNKKTRVPTARIPPGDRENCP
jgi:hypothetical protein